MPDVLVRNVREKTARSLKVRAAEDRRAVSAQAAQLLTESARGSKEAAPTRRLSREETIALSKYWRERLAGRDFPDSTALIREDRDTDHGRA